MLFPLFFFSACGIFYLADRLEKIREGACAAASKNVDKHARVCKKKGLIYYINRIYENFRCLIFPRNAWIWPNQSWAKT